MLRDPRVMRWGVLAASVWVWGCGVAAAQDAVPDDLRRALLSAGAYVESVTPYRSPPMDKVIFVTPEQLAKADVLTPMGRTLSPTDGSAPVSSYVCPGGKPPGVLLLRTDRNYANNFAGAAALVHEAVHHAQCWAGVAGDVCTSEGEAYRIEAGWVRRLVDLARTPEGPARFGAALEAYLDPRLLTLIADLEADAAKACDGTQAAPVALREALAKGPGLRRIRHRVPLAAARRSRVHRHGGAAAQGLRSHDPRGHLGGEIGLRLPGREAARHADLESGREFPRISLRRFHLDPRSRPSRAMLGGEPGRILRRGARGLRRAGAMAPAART